MTPRLQVDAPHYPRVVAEALRRPWCVTTEMAGILVDVLRFRALGGRLTADEIAARIGPPARRAAQTIRPSVRGGAAIGVVPIYGVIAHRTFEASSGMTSIEAISAMLRRAIADPDIRTIVLDLSSPGGGVEGVPELAREIAASPKHVVAIANNLAASAAYWLASQADELVVIPSGQVGSLGVYLLHCSHAEELAKAGIQITAVSRGDKKLEGAPWAPLDASARAHFQAQVDETYTAMMADVARGRGVSRTTVEADYGQGRVFTAEDAKRRGLVDRIETFDALIDRLGSPSARRAGGASRAARVRQAAEVADRQLIADAQAMARELARDADDGLSEEDGELGEMYRTVWRMSRELARADED